MQGLVQLALDLFDAMATPWRDLAPVQPSAEAPLPNSRRGRTRTGAPPRSATPEPIDRADLLEGAYQHVGANREVLLKRCRVGYEFKRGKRRTIGFQVGPRGLEVRAPRWVSQREVDQALCEKADWILRKLQEMQERASRQQLRRIEWRDGSSLPYLGEPLLLLLDPRQGVDGAAAALVVDQATLPGMPCATLHIGLPQTAAPEQIAAAVQAWLMRSARERFSQRLSFFAPKLGVIWRRLSLSSAGTRWGSAGADGSIRLNWRLIHFRPEVIDYVVVHELSHLLVMDHSARFWRTVQGQLPDYVALRGELRDDSLPHG